MSEPPETADIKDLDIQACLDTYTRPISCARSEIGDFGCADIAMSRVTETADSKDLDIQACLDTDVTSIACARSEIGELAFADIAMPQSQKGPISGISTYRRA